MFSFSDYLRRRRNGRPAGKPSSSPHTGPRRRDRKRPRPLVELLEDRTLLSITYSSSNGTLDFASDNNSDNLYLKLDNQGTVSYTTDTSAGYTSTGFKADSHSVVTAEIAGTMYLAGMDSGGGTYRNVGRLQPLGGLEGHLAVEVTGNLATLGGDLAIEGSRVTVDDGTSTQPVVVSTSSAGGAAGSLTLKAPSITVGSHVQLLAQGSGGGSSRDGAISLTAKDTVDDYFFFLANLLTSGFKETLNASITVGAGSQVRGGDVSITATAGNVSSIKTPGKMWEGLLSEVGLDLAARVSNDLLSLPVSVVIRDVTSTVDLGGSASIVSSGAVTLATDATANASGSATFFLPISGGGISFAYSDAEATAKTSVESDATISADSSIQVGSSTTTTAYATAAVAKNLTNSTASRNAVGLAASYARLRAVSHATVEKGAVLASNHGHVQVNAVAEETTTGVAESRVNLDGLVSLSGSYTDSDADVKAYVDGTIHAAADPSPGQSLNPFSSSVDLPSSRFVFANDPGYTLGEPLTYSTGGGGPIPGLVDGTTYYAIPSHSDGSYFIRLARTLADASLGSYVSFDPYPTLQKTDGTLSIPITTLNSAGPDGDSARWTIAYDFDPGLKEGDAVTITPKAGNAIGYDDADGNYLGLLPAGTYYVHLISTVVNASSRFLFQLLTNPSDTTSVVRLDDSPALRTGSGKVVRIRSFDTDAGTITLNPADLAGLTLDNGDTLTYSAGLSARVAGLTDGTTYYAISNPADFSNIDPANPPRIQLALSLNDAQAAAPELAGSYPSFTWTDGGGTSHSAAFTQVDPTLRESISGTTITHSFSIVSSDPATQILVVSNQGGAAGTAFTEGEEVQYYGAVGDSTTLQDGQAYKVHIIDQSDPGHIEIQLIDPTSGLAVPDASTDGVDPLSNAVAFGSNPSIANGQRVTYHAGLGGNAVVGLADGQEYLAVVDSAHPQIVHFTDLAGSPVSLGTDETLEGNGQVYTIVASDPYRGVLTLSAPAGSGAGPIAEGTPFVFSGTIAGVTRGLVSGRAYYAHVVDQGDSDAILIQLKDAPGDGGQTLDLRGPVDLVSLDQTYMSGSSHSLTPIATKAISITAQIMGSDASTGKTALGTSDSLALQALRGLQHPGQFASYLIARGVGSQMGGNGNSGQQTQVQSRAKLANFELSGSFASSTITNTAIAEVGPDAVLVSGAGIDVDATVVEHSRVFDKAGVTQLKQSSNSLAVAMAVAVDLVTNRAKAYVDGGARVDAAGQINVESHVELTKIANPLALAEEPQNFVDQVLADPEGAITALLLDNTSSVSQEFLTKDIKIGLTGSVTYTQVTNDSEAKIRAGALINQGVPTQGPGQGVAVKATTDFERVSDAGDAKFQPVGFAEWVIERARYAGTANFTTYAPANNFGAAANIEVLNNNTEAIIEGGAKVNFGDGGLVVDADLTGFNLMLGATGSIAKQGQASLGIDGMFTYLNDVNTTRAAIQSGAVIRSDPATTGDVRVVAADSSDLITLAGAFESASRTGMGFSGAVNDVTRTTEAILGDDAGTTSPGSSTYNVGGDIEVEATNRGNIFAFSLAATVAVPAKPAGGGAEASVVQLGNESGDSGAASNAASQAASSRYGFGVSGDTALSLVTDDTKAYINDAGGITAASLTVKAEESTVLVNATGAFAVAAQQSTSGNYGLAGSYSEIDLHGGTAAFIRHATVVTSGDVDVSARRDNYAGALSAGGAGAAVDQNNPSGSASAIAGSVSYNVFGGDTRAYLSDVRGAVGGAVGVTAEDESVFISIDGAYGRGNNTGIGAAVGFNSITHTVAAYLEKTSLSIGSNLDVEAKATTTLVGVGISGGSSTATSDPSKGGFAGAGNAVVNQIEMTLDAHISQGSSIAAVGGVTVHAEDTSTSAVVSGALALASGTSSKGLGAAVAYNLIANSLSAYVDSSTVGAGGGDLDVSAKSTPTMITLAAGGAGADSFAMGGSVAVNAITNGVDAHIASSSASSSGDMSVTATESATTVAVAGGVGVAAPGGGSTGSAVGAAVAYNYVGQSFDPANPATVSTSTPNGSTTTAYIESSTMVSGGRLQVSAGYVPASPLGTTSISFDDKSDGPTSISVPVSVDTMLVSVALGGANANNFSLGGSLSLSFVRETIHAYVSGNSRVTASGDVEVTALDSSTIGSFAGAVAVSKQTASVGAAAATGDIANDIMAYIEGSVVTSTAGGVSVVSQETAKEYDYAAGGDKANNFALGGSIVVDTIDNGVDAHIGDGSTVTGNVDVVVSSEDTSEVSAGAGQVEFAVASGSVAIGAAVITSTLANTVRAYIEDSRAKAITGEVDVLAESDLTITSGAAGGTGASDFALGGAVVYNKVTSSTRADVAQGSTVSDATGLSISATDSSTIQTGAGQVTLVTHGSSVGAAIAFNDITSTVSAYVDASTVDSSGPVRITADSSESILAIALGVSGSVPSEYLWQVDDVGSGAGNTISATTEALIKGSTVRTANGGSVALTAVDDADIVAAAGVLDLVYSSENSTHPVFADGASGASNMIGSRDKRDVVRAAIEASLVDADGGVSLSATAKPSIGSHTYAGTGSYNSSGRIGLFGAGAGSENVIYQDVLALIEGGSVVTSHQGDVSLSAIDNADITADAGGVTIGIGADTSNTTVTAGAALALNQITSSVVANIDQSTVTASGDVSLTASTADKDDPSKAGLTILATALGIAGSLSTSQGFSDDNRTINFAAAGSGAGNWIYSNVEATITGPRADQGATTSYPTVVTGSDVTLSATDDASITAVAGSAVLSAAFGGQYGSTQHNYAVGVSAATNSLGTSDDRNTVTAAVEDATVVARGSLSIEATSESSILAVTVAGAIDAGFSGRSGGKFSPGIAGAGSGSANTIYETTRALIDLGSSVSTGDGEAVRVAALNNANIVADAVGVALTLVGYKSTTGLSIQIGAAVALNTIDTITDASIDSSAVHSGGAVDVSASTADSSDASKPGERIIAVAISVGAGLQEGTVFSLSGSGVGSVGLNTLTSRVAATITGCEGTDASGHPLSVSAGAGGVTVTAIDQSYIRAITGSLAVSITTAGNVPRGMFVSAEHGYANTGFAIASSFGFAVADNDLTNTTRASIDASNISSTGPVGLAASSNGDILSVTVAGSGASSGGKGENGFAFSGAGAGSENSVTGTTSALIDESSTVVAGGDVTLTAKDTSTILADANGLTLARATGAANTDNSISLGAAASVNDVTSRVAADVEGSTVTATGAVSLSAESKTTITAVAAGLGGSLTGGQTGLLSLTGVGSGSSNTITATTEALIRDGEDASGTNHTSTVTSGHAASGTPRPNAAVTLSAKDDSTITAGSGALAVGVNVSSSPGVAAAMGISLAVNTIGTSSSPDSVIAAIRDGSVVDAGGPVTIAASSEQTITAVTIAGVGSGSSQGAPGLDGAGAGSGNQIAQSTQAVVDGHSRVSTQNGGAVSLSATDKATIKADAGGLSISISGGANGGSAVAVGAAAAVNTITTDVAADIKGSTVAAAGAVSLTATSTDEIDAYAAGIAGSLSGGSAMSFSLAGVGSASSNSISSSTEALIGDGPDVDGVRHASSVTSGVPASGSALDDQGVTLTATDKATISAGSGALAVGANYGGNPSTRAAVGLSIAVNQMGTSGSPNRAVAAIEGGSAVNSGGAVSISASSDPDITAITIAGTGSGATQGGVGLNGAGAGSGNEVHYQTKALIADASLVSSGNSRGVSLSADSTADIEAVGNALSLAGTGGAANGGATVSNGAAAALNTIDSTVLANIDGSSVASDGAVSLSASSSETITAVTVGIGGVLKGSSGGFSWAGAGSGSGNSIAQATEATITDCSGTSSGGLALEVSSGHQGAISLTASDTSKITAGAGVLSLAFPTGASSNTIVVGASVAVNNIGTADDRDRVVAEIDNSKVTSDGALDLEATSKATIKSYTYTGSGSVGSGQTGETVGIAGAGAGSGNFIYGDTLALIRGNSQVVTGHGGGVTLSAYDNAAITADAGAVTLGIAGVSDPEGASITAGAAAAVNQITGTVEANIDRSAVTSAGAVSLTASTADRSDSSKAGQTIYAVAFGVAGSLTSAASSTSPAQFTGAGSGSSNAIFTTVEATITGSQADSAATSHAIASVVAGGGVTLTALDHASITAGAGSLVLASGGGSNSTPPAVGISVAINQIGSETNHGATVAAIRDAAVYSAGGVALKATSLSTIDAVTVAGAFARSSTGNSGGSNSGISGIAGAGAGSENDIYRDTRAVIDLDSSVQTGTDQALSLSAVDNSSITADAGGFSLAILGFSSSAGSSTPIGAAAAVNVIKNSVVANIDSSSVTSGGALSLTATTADKDDSSQAGETIVAYSFSAALGVTTSDMKGTKILAGAGSGSGNTVDTTVSATITNSGGADPVVAQTNQVTAGGAGMSLHATDRASILAVSGSLSLSSGNSVNKASSSTSSFGVAVAVNEVTNTVSASIDASWAVSGGGIELKAISSGTIATYTIAGAGSDSSGKGSVGTSIAGAGAGSENDITSTVSAAIDGGSDVEATGGDLKLSAESTASITADANGLSLAAATGGTNNNAVTVGAAAAQNSITSTVEAQIGDATAVAGGKVSLAATSDEEIDAYAAGLAGSLTGGMTGKYSLAGVGSGSGNTITSHTAALIEGGSSVTAGRPATGGALTSGKGVSLTAKDTSTITAGSGAIAFGVNTSSNPGVAAAVGISLAVNT
ncbi:hypothetical protein, partial [Aquisphaera insulae]|uniref:hypothetical protein n=1 Tax=Aquisphaera insulae TaxID=2712864 RepID=UPI0013EA7265